LDKSEEHRLEGILGIMLMPGDPATDSENDRTVRAHYLSKGSLIPLTDKPGEKFSVGCSAFLKLSKNFRRPACHHRSRPHNYLYPMGAARVARWKRFFLFF
jgi:hypothetical protein